MLAANISSATLAGNISQESCDEPLQLTAWCDDAEEKEVAAMPPSVQPSSAGKVGPDGCRSWFIASLCFLVNLLFSSFFRCGGLFFTSMMSTYQATRAQAAMPLGAYCGFVNLSGLVAGALIHSFGMRISVLLGGLLMSAGCLASAFATGIPFLVVSIGVITGHFRDANGSYSGLFHFMGGMVFTSVLLTGWLWVSSTRKNKLKHNALRVKAMAD
ncbi:monocarboxylate transporter 7-like isoform X3 [Dermacentor silvarum]|uniref:monocarboxylate transporter 7-like isoform X3 n=1 Tax=Dermacentor silvarum TaxID=543639 RepID=UPI002100B089|nr:monocarboxylate transporter 7-like isoform X3 [Dermacentor silvarum]